MRIISAFTSVHSNKSKYREFTSFKTSANLGYGSYNTLETEVTNRIRKGRFSSVVSGSYNRTDGHRTDMNFEQYGVYAKLGYDLSNVWSMRADVNITHFNASQPGATTAPLTDAGIRIDHHSRIGTEWIPQAGISFHLPSSIEVKASASKGFRYPTIREMYMFPPQNPDLQPERMWNYELAFSQRLLDGRLSYGVNIFYIDGENLILTLPNPNGSGRLNQNSGNIYHSGFELQTGYRINKAWSVDANALDRACIDLVRSSEDHGKIHLIERIDSRNGMHN